MKETPRCAIVLASMPISVSLTVIVCIAIAGIAIVARDKMDEARRRRASLAAFHRWKRRRQRLEHWLAQESYRSLESPEGQHLLSLEAGAYALYLITLDHPTAGEERYLQERLALLSSDASTWRPAL